MTKIKEEIKIKWDWKIFLIILLLVLWLWDGYNYSVLENEYNNLYDNYTNYQQEVQKLAYELSLNLTQEIWKIESNYDCYERGTVECYEGRVFCYDEPQ